MADLPSAYPPGVWLVLLAAGALIGPLAGLLGVGGGVAAVPVLIDIFDLMALAKAPAVALAVGTAQ